MTSPTSALVIDDDAIVRKVVARELRTIGIPEVTTACGGTQALAILRAGARFDLVVSDLEMPDGDGIEFLRELGQLCPRAGLILMSGSEPGILQAAGQLARRRNLRILGTLGKPVDRAGLSALIAQQASTSVAPRAAGPDPVAGMAGPDELRAALDAHEFVVFVQPQLRMASLELAGVEALVRWRSPSRGNVPPALFVAQMERAGLIDDLTSSVVQQSVEALAAWRSAGLDTRISVNFSASTLSRLNAPELLLSALESRGLSRRHLVVELTETAVAGDIESLLDVATRLRLRGVHLSIDDFGTGYSSLSQLQSLPFSELKVDQTFVGIARSDASARAIVESSINLGHKLGLEVVAEGVETAEDFHLMREMGCEIAQGYLLARPFHWNELAEWDRQRPSRVAALRGGPGTRMAA